MLSELRKDRVGFILANQYLCQLELEVRDAILGNVGTLICFRVSVPDAEILAKSLRRSSQSLISSTCRIIPSISS